MTLASAPPVDVIELLPDEREQLVQLLGDLSAQQWDAPTECPAWSVKGIALHLLGDDVSLLSRQRDGEPPGVVVEATGPSWPELMIALDHFNEDWVQTAGFLSPAVITDLLRVTGDWTSQWYATVDPNRLGETIHWISPADPQPYGLLAAREYLERWIHQLQIRRAVDRPGLTDEQYVVPAVAMTLRGFPRGLVGIPAEPDTTVTFVITDTKASWTLRRTTDGWVLQDGEPPRPNVRLGFSLDSTAALFSRGLPGSTIEKHVTVEGRTDLGDLLVGGLAAFFGREA